jgi:ABC-type antimicrobial peptide transport system permease subunit
VFAALTDRIRAIPGVESVAASTAASTRLLSSWLYGDTPLDPQTFVLAALTILAVAAGATYFPARRASRVDPLGALRVE